MSLAAPLWLAGLAALLLPLALHLLARGRARRVRVGSVQLLAAAAARQPRRIALQRPLLLLVRCLLLAAVVLALAGPRREGAPEPRRARPWVLVEPGLAGPVPGDALTPAAGGDRPEIRWLATGLPPIASDAADPAAARPDLPDLAAVPGGLWSLLREASAAAPPGSELRVVTGGRLAALSGERPALPQPVRWRVVPDARPNRWIEGARAGRGGEGPAAGAALVATSDRTRTAFTAVPLPGAGGTGAGAAPAGAELVLAGGSVRLASGGALHGDDAMPLPSAAPPVRVVLLAAAGREADARFLAAAARAAAAEAGLRLELDTTPAGASASPAPRLAFWLGDAPPPAALVAAAEAGGTLVLDAGRPEERCAGTVQPVAGGPTVSLRRCAAVPAGGPGEPSPRPVLARWTSDQGRSLLLLQATGRGRILRLAGRFHPAWSDLVLSPAFPAWLGTLMEPGGATPASAALPASDRRGDGGQGEPARSARGGPRRPRPAPTREPEVALWAALPLLLLLERWLAGRGR